MNNDLIVWMFLVYVIVASVLFVLYIRKIFRECARFEPTSKEEFQKFYKKQILKALFALILLFGVTLVIDYVFKPGEIIDSYTQATNVKDFLNVQHTNKI